MMKEKKKKAVLVILIGLILFLGFWIAYYPWGEGDSGSGRVDGSSSKSEVEKERLTPESILAGMTLREKVYQMFIVQPEQITGVGTVVAAGEATKKALENYPVGGLIYFDKNLISREQITEVIANSQSYSKIGLFISVDEEGGDVARVANTLGTTELNPMYSYRNQGKKTAKKNAGTIASEIKALGFNLDFAPVADVWSNQRNQVIGQRAYSDDFKTAAKLVAAAVEGFGEEGVLCTIKHFPGHGDTAEDSHTKMAYVTKGEKELKKEELSVFQAGIKAGADLVMVGHLMVPKLDDTYPATLSEKIIQGILREELGFEGLVITDALNMGAVTQLYSNQEIAVMAVKAGNDLLLMPGNLTEAADAIIQAVENGEITQDRIDESVLRILQKKYEAGII